MKRVWGWKTPGRLQCDEIRDQFGLVIARVEGAHKGGRPSKGDAHRVRAIHEDAMRTRQLLAAAPTLYYVLEELAAELEHQYDHVNEPESQYENERLRLIKKARAALKLARPK